MNIQIESNAFVELEKVISISSVDIELLSYEMVNNELRGTIRIFGEYYIDDKDYAEDNGLKNFNKIVPYEVVFTKNQANILDIKLFNLKFYDVAGRGIETSFIIDINYEEQKERVSEKIESNEKIKEEITQELDDLLSIKLELKDDNFFETETISRHSNNKDSKSFIKVFYYKENCDVKKLCDEHKLSYEDILLENKKYAYDNSHRIIISDSHGNT